MSRRTPSFRLLAALSFALAWHRAGAQTIKHVLTLESAKRIAAAAEAEPRSGTRRS